MQEENPEYVKHQGPPIETKEQQQAFINCVVDTVYATVSTFATEKEARDIIKEIDSLEKLYRNHKSNDLQLSAEVDLVVNMPHFKFYVGETFVSLLRLSLFPNGLEEYTRDVLIPKYPELFVPSETAMISVVEVMLPNSIKAPLLIALEDVKGLYQL